MEDIFIPDSRPIDGRRDFHARHLHFIVLHQCDEKSFRIDMAGAFTLYMHNAHPLIWTISFFLLCYHFDSLKLGNVVFYSAISGWRWNDTLQPNLDGQITPKVPPPRPPSSSSHVVPPSDTTSPSRFPRSISYMLKKFYKKIMEEQRRRCGPSRGIMISSTSIVEPLVVCLLLLNLMMLYRLTSCPRYLTLYRAVPSDAFLKLPMGEKIRLVTIGGQWNSLICGGASVAVVALFVASPCMF